MFVVPAETNTEAPRFTLCKWASSDDHEKFSEEAKFEEDDLLQNKSNSPQVQQQGTSKKSIMNLLSTF